MEKIKYIKSKPNTLTLLLEKYPDKPWDWSGISRNPNITMEIIEKYPDKPWVWHCISNNIFLFEDKVYLRQLNDIQKRLV